MQGVSIPLVLHKKDQTIPEQISNSSQNYKNVAVAVKANGVTLSGSLFQPFSSNQNSPVVLIIAGSGPTDRDGNSILLPGKNNSLLQLADSLAEYGIASLRYDKRGVGKSKPDTIMKEEDITINDIVDDAEAMYNWLKKQGFSNIYVAGHSEGSLIGMMVAEKVRPKGFISIAGAGRKAGDILKEQLSNQLTPDLKTKFDSDIDSLENGFSVSSIDPSLASLLRPSVQPYMKSWLKLDPKKLISHLNCPVLILQGAKDLQVKVTDAKNLHEAQKNSKLFIINNMNHVLKEVDSDQRNDNIKAYSDPNFPLLKEFVTSIVNFILPNR